MTRQKFSKKLLSSLCALVLAVTLLFALTLSASAAGASSGLLYLENVSSPIATPSGTGWTWEQSTATLTLDDTYDGGAIEFDNSGNELGDFTIVLEGDVTLTTTENAALQVNKANLIIQTGTYTLEVTGDTDGIFATNGALTIAGGTVIAHSGASGNQAGIDAFNSDINISGGTVTAIGNLNGIAVYGGGNLNIGGGTVTATTVGNDAIFVSDGDLTVTDGSLTANGNSSGIMIGIGDIAISDGTVTATAPIWGVGLYSVDGDITISGGTVEATGASPEPNVTGGTYTEIPAPIVGEEPVPGSGITLTPESPTEGNFTLSWGKAIDLETGPEDLRYIVYFSFSDNISTAAEATKNGWHFGDGFDIDTVNIGNNSLFPGIPVYFNVVVMDGEYNTAAYNSTSYTAPITGDAPVPGDGGKIEVDVDASTGIITLDWTIATDAETDEENLEYLLVFSENDNISTVAEAWTNGILCADDTDYNHVDASTSIFTPGTAYFNVLVKDEDNNYVAYTTTAAVTIKPYLDGRVYIVGDPWYGKTLTVDISELDTYPSGYPLGALTYEWARNGEWETPIGTGNSYKLTADDIGSTIEVRVRSADTFASVVSYYVEIAKAPAADLGVASDTFIYIEPDAAKNGSFDLRDIALAPAYGEKGAVTYTVTSFDNDFDVLDGEPTIDQDGYTLLYTLDEIEGIGDLAHVGIEITTENFETIYAYIHLLVTDKTPVEITGITVKSRAYNGQPIEPTGEAEAAGATLDLLYIYAGTAADGEYYYKTTNTPPTKAGTYVLRIETDGGDEVIGSLSIPFTIGKAPLTIAADNKSITVGDEVPEYTYTITGLADGDAEVAVFADLPITSGNVDANTAGTYTIKVFGAALTSGEHKLGENYEITAYTAGTLTVAAQTYTVTFDPNGGSVSPTTGTTDADGKLASLPTPSRSGYSFDGWFTAASGGTQVTTATIFGANDTVYAHWTANGGVDYPPNGGGSSTTTPEPSATPESPAATPTPPTDVTITTPVGGDPVVGADGTTTLPGGGTATTTDGTEITLPVGSTIDPDGKVTVGKGGARVELASGISLTIAEDSVIVFDADAPLGYFVSFSNPFDDVKPDDWFYNDVAFAVAHNLFKGTSETAFSPNDPMTRAMWITVLARLDGQDTDGGDTWYEKALAWGTESGITDGTNPDDNITREQIITMLYRYAGSPAVVGTLEASVLKDADKVSDYAKDALAWAISVGIIKGDDTGNINPQGNATRAEVAAILHRFIEAAK
ncbi:MAG: S-layer homology domain-containing protein [Oscillospiraceae bacterium]|jgi:uncharacterized repeat protein (TIGR02543 family)|nr:S-layer homology domain-containing protein [Oscillospiraceae bacterium]